MVHIYNVGDRLAFKQGGQVYKATIMGPMKSNQQYSILVDQPHPFGRGGTNGYHYISITSSSIVHAPIDPKKRISEKIRLLWNNSKYVKLNSQRAY